MEAIWILLGLCALVLLIGLRIVRVRQALVVINTFTGKVQRLAAGPAWTLVIPWLEEADTLDLTINQTTSWREDVATADRLAVGAQLVLIFGLDAQRLQAADLNGILPHLKRATLIVEFLAEYLLRALAVQFPLHSLLEAPNLHVTWAGQIQQMLDDQVAWLGVHILGVRLRLSATQSMVEAEMSAQFQARALATLISAGGMDEEQLRQLLPLHILQNHARPVHLLTTLNVQPTGDVNGQAARVHWIVNGDE